MTPAQDPTPQAFTREQLEEWAIKHRDRNTGFDAEYFNAVVLLVESFKAKSECLAQVIENYLAAEAAVTSLTEEWDRLKARVTALHQQLSTPSEWVQESQDWKDGYEVGCEAAIALIEAQFEFTRKDPA